MFSMRWPTIASARLTQEFGENPDDYKPYGFPGHEGIDLGVPVGSQFYAVADGVVSLFRPDGNASPYGNHMCLQHEGGQYVTIYAHLSQMIALAGQAVQAGQVIALSGNSGSHTTGPHLHFSLKKSGATAAGETTFPRDFVDPGPYMQARPAQPTPPAQASFEIQTLADDGLNLRLSPVVGDVIATLPYGTLLGVLEAGDTARRKVGIDNQWLWVRTLGGQVGYVAAWLVGIQGVSFSLSTPQPGLPSSEAYRVQVNCPDGVLKLYEGPGTSQAIVDTLAHGTMLESLQDAMTTLALLGQFGQWLKVRSPAQQEGWVAAWHVRLPEPEWQPAADSGLSFGLPGEEEFRPMEADDLGRLKGIGPKTAALLASVGISTFKQVAALKPRQLKAILAEAGQRARYVDSWPKQARLAAGQQWKKLEKFQQEL